MKINERLKEMRLRLEGYVMSHEGALADDDPKGTCAAHHRGAISAGNFALELLKEIEDA